MQGPQLEDGYTRIANTLLEAIYQAPFNATQLKILLLIIRYTYGFNRKSHDLSLTFIEKATGISKRYVSSELKKLIKSNVVKVYEAHTDTTSRKIGLNKRFTEWKVTGDILQMNNRSTVEHNQDTTVEQLFNTTVEQSFHQERQYKDNIKDIEEDEEEGVPSPDSLEHGKVPSHYQDDPIIKFINKVSSYYTSLTNRFASSVDEVAITGIAEQTTNFEIVKDAMDRTILNYKPRYKGDKIRTFSYFVPAIQERIAAEEAKKRTKEVRAPDGKDNMGKEDGGAQKFDKSKFLYKGGS